MSKYLNIKSLLQAKDSLSEENFKGFLKHYGIEVRGAEIEDLRALVNAVNGVGCRIGALDRFYVSYKIPQIGKEFDLLRFSEKSIINIELKRKSTEEKIKKQLVRNQYYLSFIGRNVYAFTYVSESNELYFLRDNDQLEKTKIEHLIKLLSNQEVITSESPDTLFEPSDYLVSPFNSTEKFLSEKYFLTKQQEEIKNDIINSLTSSKKAIFISIIGSAGTGKTLLAYDIVMHMMQHKKKPLIIHCGILNRGHTVLIENGWTITPIKTYGNYDFANYDLIVID
ncbi:hypothetical protein [Herbaspirillum seropedicae]|uniref:hypothetical protein n=1 Tax=Herbaspirillum seropedicae TaxID=964 RepID=UPI003D98AAED